jgi:GNAT superfamily N-acetyltransferase
VGSSADVSYRVATVSDAKDIAALHAESWRRNYRGAYSDVFLDGDVFDDRRAVWRSRLQEADGGSLTIVAESGDGLLGFAHTIFDDDPVYGALIDNLHVTHVRQRGGIGSTLLSAAATAVLERDGSNKLYLWVLEQNVDAQAFYEACGAVRVEAAGILPPGGIASRLRGSPRKLRYAWHDASAVARTPRSSAGA